MFEEVFILFQFPQDSIIVVSKDHQVFDKKI